MIKLDPGYNLVVLDNKFCLFKSCRVKLGVSKYENVACFTSIILLNRYCKEHFKNNNIEKLNNTLNDLYNLLEHNSVFKIIVNKNKLEIKKTNSKFECYDIKINNKIIGYELTKREAYKKLFTRFIMSLMDNGYKIKEIIEVLLYIEKDITG